MSQWELDVAKLAGMVDAMRRLQKLKQWELANKLGTSASVVSRLNQGHRPDADALTAICMWLNVDLRAYAKKREDDE